MVFMAELEASMADVFRTREGDEVTFTAVKGKSQKVHLMHTGVIGRTYRHGCVVHLPTSRIFVSYVDVFARHVLFSEGSFRRRLDPVLRRLRGEASKSERLVV